MPVARTRLVNHHGLRCVNHRVNHHSFRRLDIDNAYRHHMLAVFRIKPRAHGEPNRDEGSISGLFGMFSIRDALDIFAPFVVGHLGLRLVFDEWFAET
jgi:hypothetical protein